MKPTLIFDGDCNFCRRWVSRWKSATGNQVEYLSSADAVSRFPQIPSERYDTSVVFVTSAGEAFYGAEAAFRALAHSNRKRWLLWLYSHFPAFRTASEKFYSLVAGHRVFFSRVTRIFWGRNVEVPTYRFSSWLFLKALGIIYLIAFCSLWVQIPGLIGETGILPAEQFLEMVQKYYQDTAWLKFPTLAWLSATNSSLSWMCLGGMVSAVFIVVGVLPVPACFAAWLLYLSLVSVGQSFLSFQWDILLLEAGFLAIFLSPLNLTDPFRQDRQPPGIMIWLSQWLLFRLMFRSGLVKLASGDSAWSTLKAMNFHYETQPLPTWIGWYAHQLPEWMQRASNGAVFFIELLLPFLIFAPRRLRMGACLGFVSLQLLIMLTGNYCFFNLLTLALCLFLIDDQTWPKKVGNFGQPYSSNKPRPGKSTFISEIALVPLLILVLSVSLVSLTTPLKWEMPWADSTKKIRANLRPFYVVNSYGLFAVMTKRREEIIIEGSHDGRAWRAYKFKYKPGDLNLKPAFVEPHQPRLDWQMWFAALSSFDRNPWFLNLMVRLMEGEESVIKLFQTNPFEDKPPTYLKATSFEYHFTDFRERSETGNWWKRSGKRAYSPVLMKNESGITIVSRS